MPPPFLKKLFNRLSPKRKPPQPTPEQKQEEYLRFLSKMSALGEQVMESQRRRDAGRRPSSGGDTRDPRDQRGTGRRDDSDICNESSRDD